MSQLSLFSSRNFQRTDRSNDPTKVIIKVAVLAYSRLPSSRRLLPAQRNCLFVIRCDTASRTKTQRSHGARRSHLWVFRKQVINDGFRRGLLRCRPAIVSRLSGRRQSGKFRRYLLRWLRMVQRLLSLSIILFLSAVSSRLGRPFRCWFSTWNRVFCLFQTSTAPPTAWRRGGEQGRPRIPRYTR